jgi:D-alanyl-D-alanine carboxypeptidase/D-alanyl-D-alanine-endopeptidase (penicillin-binding protein 4)
MEVRMDRRSRIGRGPWIAGLLSACLLGAVAVMPAAGQSLERKVQNALAEARLGNAHVGVSIFDVQRNTELADLNINPRSNDRGFIPASNLKLLTSGTALSVLGKDFEFRTSLILDGDKLVVRGTGDPGFADPELLDKMGTGLSALLDRLVEMAKQTLAGDGAAGGGLGTIREVVLDDRAFDREYVHPEWPREQLHLSYCAQVSGLNFHANVLNVYVDPPRSQPEAPWIVIKRATRKVKDGNTELRLDREKDGPYTFKLSGTVRYAPDGPVQVTVDQSCLMLGRLLADRIIHAGMAAPGLTSDNIPVRLVGLDERIGDGPAARTLAAVRTPMSVVLERCNVDSDNLYAESLLKAAGHKSTGQPGSWANGTAVVRMQIKERLGSDYASQLVMTDGSGLSRGNRVTPEMLTRWLASLANDPQLGSTFVASLPTVGEGTLKKRFKGAKLQCEVRGKSGYIREVRSLSGFVSEPNSGRSIAYSIIINDIPAGADAKSKEFHEDVVEIIDDYLASETGLNTAKQKKAEPRERIGG